jgi:hypothetical protein
MTDEKQEGAQPTEERLAPAVLEASAETEVQQPSLGAGVTEERLKELLAQQSKTLEETIERRVQSVKDRRFAQLETRLDEAVVLKEQVEAAGGWDPYLAQQQQTEAIEKRLEQMIEARISRKPVSPQETWQAEWSAESQKILDAAKERGVELTDGELTQVKFNNGLPYGTKGDAYAALNRALLSKAIGDKTPVSVVSAEGGEAPRPPEPPKAPMTFRQKFDKARTSGNEAEARKILDEQWLAVEKQGKIEAARQTLAAAGVTPEELTK